MLAEAAGYLLGFTRAAVFIGNPAVVRRQQPWLAQFLAGRSSATGVDELVGAVAGAAQVVLPDLRILHRALGRE